MPIRDWRVGILRTPARLPADCQQVFRAGRVSKRGHTQPERCGDMCPAEELAKGEEAPMHIEDAGAGDRA